MQDGSIPEVFITTRFVGAAPCDAWIVELRSRYLHTAKKLIYFGDLVYQKKSWSGRRDTSRAEGLLRGTRSGPIAAALLTRGGRARPLTQGAVA